MKKFLEYEGVTHEGIFLPLPGKQNYGNLMINGKLLYEKTEDGKQGKPVEFSLGRADGVNLLNQDFKGFFNLVAEPKIKENPIKEEVLKPIKLNKREEIQAMSKDAEEIIIAMKKYAVNEFVKNENGKREKITVVFLKEVKGVNQNKLYGHLTNLINAGIVERIGKDEERGTKIRILR